MILRRKIHDSSTPVVCKHCLTVPYTPQRRHLDSCLLCIDQLALSIGKGLVTTLISSTRFLFSKLVIYDETHPDQDEYTGDDEIPDVRGLGDFNVVARQLETKAVVDDAQENGTSTNPPMNVSKDALSTSLLEMSMLEQTHYWLEDDNYGEDEKADDDVCVNWVLQ